MQVKSIADFIKLAFVIKTFVFFFWVAILDRFYCSCKNMLRHLMPLLQVFMVSSQVDTALWRRRCCELLITCFLNNILQSAPCQWTTSCMFWNLARRRHCVANKKGNSLSDFFKLSPLIWNFCLEHISCIDWNYVERKAKIRNRYYKNLSWVWRRDGKIHSEDHSLASRGLLSDDKQWSKGTNFYIPSSHKL